MKKYLLAAPFAALAIAGCVSLPNGPTVTAMPGNGKTFDQFQADDNICRSYAENRMNGTSPQQAANNAGVASAALGTLIGAVAGAAIGGSHGAAVGAGAGLLVGAGAGANASAETGYSAQRLYDNSYTQCMYANGERVPVRVARAAPGYYYPQQAPSGPPPGYYPPPPPAGYYGPPPANPNGGYPAPPQ